MLNSTECEVIPSSIPTDAGISGPGVLLSFVITAFIAVTLSGVIMIKSILSSSSQSRILRKLLVSFSDQQIMTGIGIQSVGLAKIDSLAPYHFFLIWMLSLLSTATHLSTLLALIRDFRTDWVLRWLRQFLMAVNLFLSCIYGIFILNATMRGAQETLPISCVWHLPSRPPTANVGLSFAGTIGVIVGNCLVFALGVWFLHSKKWMRASQAIGFVLMLAIGIGATVKVISLSQAFGNPSVPLNDRGETEWSFGQLLPLLLLILPLVSIIEVVRGETRLGENFGTDGHFELEHTFQPNPFWGTHGGKNSLS